MAEYADREHFIPFTRSKIVDMLLHDGQLKKEEMEKFGAFVTIANALYHFQFHEHLEKCKSSYVPFNPDTNYKPEPDEYSKMPELEREFLDNLDEVLKSGNFVRINAEEMKNAMEGEGLFPISLDIDFDLFEWFRVYYQGKSVGEETVSHEIIPLLKRKVKFDYFERIVLIIKYREEEYYKKRKIKIDARPGKIYLKYLKGIPCADLEMVFPNSTPRMKTFHKVQIAVPVLTCIGTLFYQYGLTPILYHTQFLYNHVWEKITLFDNAPSLDLKGTVLGIIALFGTYALKAYSGYKQTVQNFMNEITTSLYFKNLVSNQGVFTSVVDKAEEEEVKEVLLAYYFLYTTQRKLTEPELDDMIEEWFEKKHSTKLDFEVDDALRKLEELGLLKKEEKDGKVYLGVKNLDEACERLDYIWDNFFQYNKGD